LKLHAPDFVDLAPQAVSLLAVNRERWVVERIVVDVLHLITIPLAIRLKAIHRLRDRVDGRNTVQRCSRDGHRYELVAGNKDAGFLRVKHELLYFEIKARLTDGH
jgi:hypothetical protein